MRRPWNEGADAKAPRHGRAIRPATVQVALGELVAAELVADADRNGQQRWTAATAASLRTLARRIQLLTTGVVDHTRAITTLVRAWRPELLSRCGVGPIVAVTQPPVPTPNGDGPRARPPRDPTLPGPLRRLPALPTPRSPTRALTQQRSVQRNDRRRLPERLLGAHGRGCSVPLS
jgi:hypothetical protein